MSSVTLPTGTITYEYNADGIKVKTDDGLNPKWYLIDTQQLYAQVIAEYDNASSLTAEYVFGLERISQDRGGSVSVYLADGQGSIRQLTDNAGLVSDAYDYFAFGELLNKTGSTENEFRYVGEQVDPNTNFYYLRARWMDPTSGKFVSTDPWGGNVIAPLSLHRYLYANSSPVSNQDPTGTSTLISVMEAIAISAVLTSYVYPSFSHYFLVKAGGTDKFGFQFGKGVSLGYFVFGGGYEAYIWEKQPTNGSLRANPRRARFTVSILGVGVGWGAQIGGTSSEFITSHRRMLKFFAGFGRIAALEIGFGAPTYSLVSIQFPDGTYWPNSSGFNLGVGWKVSAYVALAYWHLEGID